MAAADRFSELRSRHPTFFYRAFSVEEEEDRVRISFDFLLEPDVSFAPTLCILKPRAWNRSLDREDLDPYVFHLGLVELISYWKCACPPRIVIQCGDLDSYQVSWWKALFLNGLGEFFYTNRIDHRREDLLAFHPEGVPLPAASSSNGIPAVEDDLIPVGGGKDSAVSLEILKERAGRAWLLMLNPVPAMEDTARVAGFLPDRFVTVHRRIDPGLLELNRKGYLNGHTPFSAYVGMLGVLCARLFGCRNIVLSNESSSEEGNVRYLDRVVNHQYSKSFDFEHRFAEYVNRYLHPGIRYFSLLRVFNELQIARLFSEFPSHWPVFRSCNRGRHDNTWCGSCAKCLFVYLILSPFLPETDLVRIFGEDLFSKEELVPLLWQLAGSEECKPFDCVGTKEEIRAALYLTWKRRRKEGLPLPPLLGSCEAELCSRAEELENDSRRLLGGIRSPHRIPDEFFVLLKPWMSSDA